MNLTASIDDGADSDQRFFDLMIKYDIPTTTYMPIEWHSLAFRNDYLPIKFNILYDYIHNHNIELGSHGISHNWLTTMELNHARYEIRESRHMLEKMFETEIDKFAPSRGYTNDVLNREVDKNYKSQRLTRGDNLVHIHPDSGANGNRHWIEAFYEKKENGVEEIELWGHSHEYDRYEMWDEIKDFFDEQIQTNN